ARRRLAACLLETVLRSSAPDATATKSTSNRRQTGHAFLVVDRNRFVADLLQPDVGLITRSASMTLDFPARPSSLAWSNPVAWWWGLLTLVSGVNIAVWFWLYRYLQELQNGSLGSARNVELMLLFSAAYVFGCAFRSFLPRADVQRICLFDTWLSSVT